MHRCIKRKVLPRLRSDLRPVCNCAVLQLTTSKSWRSGYEDIEIYGRSVIASKYSKCKPRARDTSVYKVRRPSFTLTPVVKPERRSGWSLHACLHWAFVIRSHERDKAPCFYRSCSLVRTHKDNSQQQLAGNDNYSLRSFERTSKSILGCGHVGDRLNHASSVQSAPCLPL